MIGASVVGYLPRPVVHTTCTPAAPGLHSLPHVLEAISGQ
jgi:hypothetical protein